jgi:hypothetical protein
VQLLATLALHGDEIGSFQYRQMLGHRLAAHVEAFAKFVQGLSVTPVQTVQQGAAAGIGQRPEDLIPTHANIMQPNGCMSSETIDGR